MHKSHPFLVEYEAIVARDTWCLWDQLMIRLALAGRPGAALVAGALLLVNSCLAMSAHEVKPDAKVAVSPTSLAAALHSTNAATRFYAVDALGKIDGSDINLFITALHDPDACVRIAAAKALSHSADPAAKSSLINVLKTEKDSEVWNMAAKPFLAKGHEAIPLFLEIFLKTDVLGVRLSAAPVLAKLGWKPETQEEKIAYYSANIFYNSDELAELGPVAIPSLCKLLAEGDEDYREAAVQTLNCITDRRVFKPIIKALADPSPVVRKAARTSLRIVSFDFVRGVTKDTGFILLAAGRLLVSLALGAIALIFYFRHRHDARPDPSKGCRPQNRLAKIVFSLDLWFALACVASLIVYYAHTNQYVEQFSKGDPFKLLYNSFCMLLPAMVMMALFDIAGIALKAAGMLKRGPGNRLGMSRLAVWLKRLAIVVWGAGVMYSFASTNYIYINASNAVESMAVNAKKMMAAGAPKYVPVPEEEARKFASTLSQAKEAVKTVDSRYLDQRQKEQVMETFVKLISIRSPSKSEGLIGDELRRMMEQLGAREIDCRKGDTNAPLNLVMEFPATEDLANAPAMMLNAHIDTVDSMFAGRCAPEGLEFDKSKGNFYHRDHGSYGADDKSGVTVIVEAVRTLKLLYWDKGLSHRRILIVFTAQEENGRKGASYLTACRRELFDDLDFSFTMDGSLWGPWRSYEYPHTPLLAGRYNNKVDTFKSKQIVAIMERFARERHKPIYIAQKVTEMSTPIDAFKLPPEAYKFVNLMAPNKAAMGHKQESNNVGQMIDYVDMLVNILEQLDADYAKAVGELQVVDTY